MARTARKKGQNLHLIVRGIGKQLLFEDDADRRYFLGLVERFRDEVNITILAYCLMDNHVHLLINDIEYQSSLFMKKLGISYAQYFNHKYERTGHLFQDRYKSEVIEDERHLLTVFRYILNNPVKAGICNAANYKWSSYKEYGKKNVLTNTLVLQGRIAGKKELDEFLAICDGIECMEDDERKHDDHWAIEIIHGELGLTSGTSLQKMSKDERNQKLRQMKEKGLSNRQIERMTGINRGIIQRA